MPVDTRRLPVPDESKPPITYSDIDEINKEKPLIGEDGKRSDGRTSEQVRPVFIRTGVVTKAKGSAYIELNNTKVICAVYGPREVTRREDFRMTGQLECDVRLATFARRSVRGQHQANERDKQASILLREALEPAVMLEKFPKAKMDVFVTVLEHDGSYLSAALTVSSVALADAGVDMYDLVIGCSVRQSGTHQLLDPAAEEEYSRKGVYKKGENEGEVLVGYMPSLDQLAALSQQGDMTVNAINKAIKLCISTCQRLYPVVQQCLTKSVEEKTAT